MKFSTQEVMDAPINAVFDMLTRFDQFERAALRRGAEIRRLDTLQAPGIGMAWHAAFVMRGRNRTLNLEAVAYEPPHRMVLELTSQGVRGDTQFELIALSTQRTRIMVSLELRPLTLPARLLLQSLKLTKTTLNRKYKERVAQYLTEMEERYRSSP